MIMHFVKLLYYNDKRISIGFYSIKQLTIIIYLSNKTMNWMKLFEYSIKVFILHEFPGEIKLSYWKILSNSRSKYFLRTLQILR